MTREPLLEILDAALTAVDGRQRTRATLPEHLSADGFHVIAIGKAAAAMVYGALDVEAGCLRRGLVISRHGYLDHPLLTDRRLVLIAGDHPVPGRQSIEAGAALLSFVETLPSAGQVVCLISGGASSLVEVLPEDCSLEDLRRLNEWMIGSGLAIRDINALRRRVSVIKGGGLAERMADRDVVALYISDVPDDDPADIGSGLLVPSSHTLLPTGLPEWVEAMVAKRASVPSRPVIVRHRIIANLDLALTAAADRAGQLGYAVSLHPGRLTGDSTAAARRISGALKGGPPGIHLWGGETTPRLPHHAGRGGRNQHLALCCAVDICDRPDLRILCAATDGSDGNTDDAGGMVDGATIARGCEAGLDPVTCLEQADSGTFLEAAGDLVVTGPTGTNVTDLVIGLRGASS